VLETLGHRSAKDLVKSLNLTRTTERRRSVVQYGVQDIDRGITLERSFAGEQFVKDRAERKNVSSRANRKAAQQLR
jgi:hypothetical protein